MEAMRAQLSCLIDIQAKQLKSLMYVERKAYMAYIFERFCGQRRKYQILIELQIEHRENV